MLALRTVGVGAAVGVTGCAVGKSRTSNVIVGNSVEIGTTVTIELVGAISLGGVGAV